NPDFQPFYSGLRTTRKFLISFEVTGNPGFQPFIPDSGLPVNSYFLLELRVILAFNRLSQAPEYP
ncbi:MAG TPA: hypothetical protein PLN48_06150, partial [Lachnospiraceae bacterium]|nr:hypothetical protein [Lachnospiraceae bacterium]